MIFGQKLRAGIIVFLGTNCDRDTKMALDALNFETEYVFHTSSNLEKYDLIVLPGGFSFGDYIRAGRLAKLSPVMDGIKRYIKSKRGFVLGICNGFQILCEAGLLPGALIENKGAKFISEDEKLLFNAGGAGGAEAIGDTCGGFEEIILPIAHKEGCFWADEETLQRIEEKNMAIIRYKTGGNPNGSINNIAGLYDSENKVFGLMPHPERAVLKGCSEVFYLKDGVKIFEFIRAEILKEHSGHKGRRALR